MKTQTTPLDRESDGQITKFLIDTWEDPIQLWIARHAADFPCRLTRDPGETPGFELRVLDAQGDTPIERAIIISFVRIDRILALEFALTAWLDLDDARRQTATRSFCRETLPERIDLAAPSLEALRRLIGASSSDLIHELDALLDRCMSRLNQIAHSDLTEHADIPYRAPGFRAALRRRAQKESDPNPFRALASMTSQSSRTQHLLLGESFRLLEESIRSAFIPPSFKTVSELVIAMKRHQSGVIDFLDPHGLIGTDTEEDDDPASWEYRWEHRNVRPERAIAKLEPPN